MESPKIIRYASIALIISGLILIFIPLLYRFNIIEGEFKTSNVGIGLVFLILGFLTFRKTQNNG